MMRSILMMKMRKVQKLTVCKVYDAQDFKIEDEVTEVEITEDSLRIVEEMRFSLWITTLRMLIKLRMHLISNMLKKLLCGYERRI